MSGLLWGAEPPTTCDHGERALTCTACRDERVSQGVSLFIAALVVFGVMALASRALEREAVIEQQQLEEHLDRLERHLPGARQRLRELAAEQQAIGGLR